MDKVLIYMLYVNSAMSLSAIQIWHGLVFTGNSYELCFVLGLFLCLVAKLKLAE